MFRKKKETIERKLPIFCKEDEFIPYEEIDSYREQLANNPMIAYNIWRDYYSRNPKKPNIKAMKYVNTGDKPVVIIISLDYDILPPIAMNTIGIEMKPSDSIYINEVFGVDMSIIFANNTYNNAFFILCYYLKEKGYVDAISAIKNLEGDTTLIPILFIDNPSKETIDSLDKVHAVVKDMYAGPNKRYIIESSSQRIIFKGDNSYPEFVAQTINFMLSQVSHPSIEEVVLDYSRLIQQLPDDYNDLDMVMLETQ